MANSSKKGSNLTIKIVGVLFLCIQLIANRISNSNSQTYLQTIINETKEWSQQAIEDVLSK